MQTNEHTSHITQDIAPTAREASHDHGAGDDDHTRGVPSKAAIAGHPIHPPLIVFPVPLLAGASAADVGY